MAGARAEIWKTVKSCIAGALIGATVADSYACLVPVQGPSMRPTFEPDLGEIALVDRRRLDFTRGDVVVFRYPADHRKFLLNRLIALPGDWIQVPETAEIRQIPKGHCWVEGDNAGRSWDSRNYGPGRVTHTVWPPHRIGPVDRKMPEGRVVPR